MFINFRSIIEWIFSSFDVAGDTKLLQKLEKDGVRFLMIVKKHWIYSLLISWRIIFVIIIACINIYLLIFSKESPTSLTIFIASLLGLNVLYWIYIIISYVIKFYRIQGNKPYIVDIYSALKQSEESDAAFTKFFNQTIFLLVLLVGLTLFTVISSLSSLFFSGDSSPFFACYTAYALL